MGSPAKRIAATIAVLMAILMAWLLWRSGQKPAEVSAPVPSVPVAATPSPIVTEARPAPPVEAVKPLITLPASSVEVHEKKAPAKKPIPPKPFAKPPPTLPVTIAREIPSVPLVPPEPPPLAPREWMGNDTSITHVGEVVIHSDHQWIAFWAEHHPDEAAPDVDFSKEMVVGVFAGPRPAEQFTIRIENVRTLSGSLVVDYRETLPPPGTFAVNVTVYPYHVKVIPRTDLKVKFNKLALIDNNR